MDIKFLGEFKGIEEDLNKLVTVTREDSDMAVDGEVINVTVESDSYLGGITSAVSGLSNTVEKATTKLYDGMGIFKSAKVNILSSLTGRDSKIKVIVNGVKFASIYNLPIPIPVGYTGMIPDNTKTLIKVADMLKGMGIKDKVEDVYVKMGKLLRDDKDKLLLTDRIFKAKDLDGLTAIRGILGKILVPDDMNDMKEAGKIIPNINSIKDIDKEVRDLEKHVNKIDIKGLDKLATKLNERATIIAEIIKHKDTTFNDKVINSLILDLSNAARAISAISAYVYTSTQHIYLVGSTIDIIHRHSLVTEG